MIRMLFLVCVIVAGSVFSQSLSSLHLKATCLTDPKLQAVRSMELKIQVNADQKAREHWEKLSQKQLATMNTDDLKRRVRVAEIFAEGCFKLSADYAAAAVIYQHGDVADHYYQAFIWASRAVSLGDESQKHLVALAIDRYLVSIGKKQLFGSQLSASSADDWCYCMQPVEASFPDAMRQQYLGMSLKDEYARMALLNKGKNNCRFIDCPEDLGSSLKGSVPGFW